MDLPAIGEQPFVYRLQPENPKEVAAMPDEDVAEWDNEKEFNYKDLAQSVFQEYNVLKHIEDIEALLISRDEIIENAKENVRRHRESFEFAVVFTAGIQLAKLKRELSDEVLNEKLNILKNTLKAELKYQTNSIRILQLEGWIKNIRDFQCKWALSPKYKLLKQVENVGKVVAGGVEDSARTTVSKISTIGSIIKGSCPSYEDLTGWGIETLGQVSDTVPFLKHYFPKPEELEEKKPKVEAIDEAEVEVIDQEGE